MDPDPCRIVLRGELGPRFAAAFPGFALDVADGMTVLSGTIADQAQLFSLLQKARDLAIDVLGVEVGGVR